MSTEIGDLTTSGTVQQVSQKYGPKGQLTESYVVATSNESTFLSGYTIGVSTKSGLYLADITVRRNKGVSRIDLEYTTIEELTNRYIGDSTIKGSEAASVERSIFEHPDCSNKEERNTGAVPVVGGNLKPGVESYLTPSITYTYTENVDSFTFSEANVVDGVGGLSDPTGMTSPTAGSWLKVSKSVQSNGESYTITETWQHRGYSNGTAGVWDPDIY